jgi:hypothetical protein
LQLASYSIRNKVSKLLLHCDVKPPSLLLYTECSSSYCKKIMDHNLTNSCRKCSCQENVLYVYGLVSTPMKFQAHNKHGTCEK